MLHADLDQFIVAVELLRRPELRGRPVLVGGSGEIVPASTEMERWVLGVWAATFALEPEQLSVEANFFDDLGGHSLVAANVTSAMRWLPAPTSTRRRPKRPKSWNSAVRPRRGWKRVLRRMALVPGRPPKSTATGSPSSSASSSG